MHMLPAFSTDIDDRIYALFKTASWAAPKWCS